MIADWAIATGLTVVGCLAVLAGVTTSDWGLLVLGAIALGQALWTAWQ